jgi:hypothetical protein
LDVPGCPGNHPSSNIALLTATTAAPVIPVDFSKPCFFRQLQLTKPQPYPFALLNTDTSTTLRVQYLSKPKQPLCAGAGPLSMHSIYCGFDVDAGAGGLHLL